MFILGQGFTPFQPPRVDLAFLAYKLFYSCPIGTPHHQGTISTAMWALELSDSQSFILAKILLELNHVSVSDT